MTMYSRLTSELEQVKREKEALNTQLDAWHSVFGTSQLSHAQARLEVAEKKSEQAKQEGILEGMARANDLLCVRCAACCGIDVDEAIRAEMGKLK